MQDLLAPLQPEQLPTDFNTMKKEFYLSYKQSDFWADFSFVDFSSDYLKAMEGPISKALQAMSELESGAISNPDENRMVGHYWLRDPDQAPSAELSEAIKKTYLSYLKDN